MTSPLDLRVLVPPTIGPSPTVRPAQTQPQGGTGFAEELDRAARKEDVAFSAHASERLARRGISLSEADRTRLSDAVDSVGAKGGRNSLVMLGNTALIVNVPNRTVVTAMGAGSGLDRVITNIDSAVIA